MNTRVSLTVPQDLSMATSDCRRAVCMCVRVARTLLKLIDKLVQSNVATKFERVTNLYCIHIYFIGYSACAKIEKYEH